MGAVQPSKRRWVALGQLCLLTCLNCCQWINFATIVDQSRAYFGVSNAQLNWMSVIFMLVYVALEPFAVSIFEVFGLRRGLLVSSFLNTVGAALKLVCALTRSRFPLLFVAQLIAACAQIFSLGCPPLMSSAWFPDDERTLATAIASTANTLGNAIGLLVPPLIVTSATRSDFSLFFGVQLGLCALDLLINLFAVSAPPPSPEEKADAVAKPRPPASALIRTGFSSLWQALKVPSFTLLNLALGFLLGVFWSLSTFSAQLLQPFGASESQVGGMGFTSIAFGATASLIVCPLIDRRRQYWVPCVGLMALATVSFAVLTGVLFFEPRPNSVALLWMLYTVIGMAQTTVIPVAFEFAAELTYPIDTSVSGGMLMITANLIAAVVILGLTPVLGDNPAPDQVLKVCVAFVAMYALATLLAVLVPEDLRRLRAERHKPASGAPTDECDRLVTVAA